MSPELRDAGRQQQIADDGSQLVMPINRYVSAAHGVLSDAEQRLSPAKKDEMVHLINPRVWAGGDECLIVGHQNGRADEMIQVLDDRRARERTVSPDGGAPGCVLERPGDIELIGNGVRAGYLVEVRQRRRWGNEGYRSAIV